MLGPLQREVGYYLSFLSEGKREENHKVTLQPMGDSDSEQNREAPCFSFFFDAREKKTKKRKNK